MNKTGVTMATHNLQNNVNNKESCKNSTLIDCQDNYEVLAVDNLSESINNQPNCVANSDDYEILAIDKLSHSVKNPANLLSDNDNKSEEPADNTLNEELDQPNSDAVIVQRNFINKKRLVGFILGTICFFTGTAILFVLFWYIQLRSGIGIPMNPTESTVTGTDLVTHTDMHENITYNLVLQQRIIKQDCFQNCADLYQLGHREDKVNTFEQCGETYQLYCDMTQDGGGWTVIQRRFDGSVDFYRNWDSYKAWFGNLTTEFWLGNDLISLLTKHKKFDLHIYLEDFEGEHRHAEYSDFQLGDENEKYVLHIGNYSGDAGDALIYQKGKKFSTYDSDNDPSSRNCASRYHGAFWFSTCYHAYLNGQYSATSSGVGMIMGLCGVSGKAGTTPSRYPS